MNRIQKIEVRQSENREKARALLDLEEKTPEQLEELRALTAEQQGLEVELRAALAVEVEEEAAPVVVPVPSDGEAVELRALRARASLGRFLVAGMEGRPLDGAESEYRLAVGAAERCIPLDLLSSSEEEPAVERRADVVTPAQTPVGFTFASIVPAVFARSVAPRLGIAMPRVTSGSYSVPRITTNLSAGMEAAGGTAESTAAAFTVSTTTPHRCSARLSLREEDVRSAGMPAFEASLRSNLRAVMSDVVDREVLRGSGAGASITGLANRLTAAGAESNTITFGRWASKVAGLIDGKWATMLSNLRLLVNPAVYGKLASVFASGDDSVSALDWSGRHGVNVSTSSQMAPSASSVGDGIAFRSGGGISPSSAASMPACMPVWGDVSIDDMYTGAASATRHVTLHVFLGDVIVRQPDAYRAFKVKTG